MSEERTQSNLSTGRGQGQAGTLAAVLDEIIPPSSDGRFPGAGELGLARHVQDALERSPGQWQAIGRALTDLDELAQARGADDFAALARRDRLEVLKELEAKHAGFLPGLIFHTYTGYYLNSRVIEALGLQARPPHPEGYEMEPNDFTLLDGVRERPPLYRCDDV